MFSVIFSAVKNLCWQGAEKFGELRFCENELREKKCWDYLVYEVCDGKTYKEFRILSETGIKKSRFCFWIENLLDFAKTSFFFLMDDV